MDYYRILEVKPTASAAVIKRAYREKAKLLHPDVNPSPRAHEEFVLINEAYEVLIDEIKRRYYDRHLRRPKPHRATEPQQKSTAQQAYEDFVRQARTRASGYSHMGYEAYKKTDFYRKAARVSNVVFATIMTIGFGFLIAPLIYDVPGGSVYNIVFMLACTIPGCGLVMSGYVGIISR